MLKFIRKYDAEIIACIGTIAFLLMTATITEAEREEQIRQMCNIQPGLPECATISKEK